MHRPAPSVPQEALCPRSISLRSQLTEAARLAEVVIGICVRNQAKNLPSALASAMTQQVVQDGKGVVVILDDASGDNWHAAVSDWLADPRVVVVSAVCGTAARARNALLDWVDSELPAARWVARLDADDQFADRTAVSALMEAGEQAEASFVLGSNHLAVGGARLPQSNIAQPSVLQDRERLVAFIEAFCLNGQQQELPSCNLLLQTGTGVRYPDTRSAEDHWLVAELLMFDGHRGIVVPYPVYAVYSLGGTVTKLNRRSAQWGLQRQRLAAAVRCWLHFINRREELLGVGQEGVVWKRGGRVHKRFYPWAINDSTVDEIRQLTVAESGPVPKSEWLQQRDGSWQCSYEWFASNPVPKQLPVNVIRDFLRKLHQSAYVTSNIKRSNMRVDAAGRLVYIDIGNDIVPFSSSRFLDAAARLYSICVLGQPDHELVRRTTTRRQHEALNALPGFADFYRSLIEELYPHCCLAHYESALAPARRAAQVTLLIKTCAQDADSLEDQVKHIVSQLAYPASFVQTVLLIDPSPGPFLRQYANSDLPRVQRIALNLQEEGVVDDVWQAPETSGDIRASYRRWFGRDDISVTHTGIGAPLFAQLWAFDRVATPYVLQCDVDILVARRDLTHDYLADMCAALDDDVLSVGFNIPQPESGFKPYQGEPGQFAPEIRCGLLHLPRLRALCPLPNTVKNGRFELMWHRSVQQAQAVSGSRSLRGGDSRSYYLHPMNSDKLDERMSLWRDLVAQGGEPSAQKGKWDLLSEANWRYPERREALVFLLKGRGTSIAQLRRSLGSLAAQHDQRFGLIVIDDGSPFAHTWHLPLLLGAMRERTTLIRQRRREGYVRNLLTAIGEVCTDPETLIVTLDLDDALMSPRVSARLMQAITEGADVINGGMFRPDKPLQLYEPDYRQPRAKGGGNVWAHLRGFRKRLFDALPRQYLEYDGTWVDDVTDYAVMLPLCELARHPTFIGDLFCYYHQREPYSATRKAAQQSILTALFSLPPARWPDAVVPYLSGNPRSSAVARAKGSLSLLE